MARADTFEARNRKAQLLQWHLVEGVTQKEIASRLGITRVRVSQLIGRGLDEVVKGKIAMPADFDYASSRLLVSKMVFTVCCRTWESYIEVSQNYEVISRLTIPEQLEWVRKSKKIRWYQ